MREWGRLWLWEQVYVHSSVSISSARAAALAPPPPPSDFLKASFFCFTRSLRWANVSFARLNLHAYAICESTLSTMRMSLGTTTHYYRTTQECSAIKWEGEWEWEGGEPLGLAAFGNLLLLRLGAVRVLLDRSVHVLVHLLDLSSMTRYAYWAWSNLPSRALLGTKEATRILIRVGVAGMSIRDAQRALSCVMPSLMNCANCFLYLSSSPWMSFMYAATCAP